MAMIQWLNGRITHKYRDGWSNLDEWEYICLIKVLRGRNIRIGKDNERTWTNRVIVPRSMKEVDLSRHFYSHFGGTNCKHEHDCCGCALYSIEVHRASKREYVIRTVKTYNY